MDKSEIIQKWIAGTLSDEERADFVQSEEYKALVEVSEGISNFKAPEYDVEGELSRLKPKLRAKKIRTINISQLALRVAALVILTMGLTYLLLPEDASELKEISAEVTPELVLPDNSEVKLNAKSSLTFDANGWDDNRKVNLTGEAYFQVAKGTNFEVATVSGMVQVLGTSFNVKDRDGVLEVTCYSGKVRVSNQKNQVTLNKGEKVALTKQTFEQKTIISSATPTWLDGKSSFRSAPLIYVIKEFERQYDVIFKLDGVDSASLFTGTFTHADLKIGLESITLPLHLSYQITKDHIVLSNPD